MNLNINPLNALIDLNKIPYQIFEEYLSNLDKYKHISIFTLPVRIAVPNEEISVYDEYVDLTYNEENKFLTGVQYTLYEYVPGYYTSPTVFSLIDTPDKGTLFDTNLSFSIIGFSDITIGSFLQFYTDYLSNYIFEVINIRTPILTNIKVPILDLDLKVANIRSLDELNISNIYYFDWTEDKFIPKELYDQKIQAIEYITTTLIPDIKQNCFDYNSENYIPQDNIYLQYFYFYYIGQKINKNHRRFDLPIPIDPIENPEKYSSLNLTTLDDFYNALDCVNASVDCILKTCELIQKLKEAGYV